MRNTLARNIFALQRQQNAKVTRKNGFSSSSAWTRTTSTSSTLLGTRWRGPDECIVAQYRVLQQLGPGSTINRCLRLCHSFVFHQGISLDRIERRMVSTSGGTKYHELLYLDIASPTIEIEVEVFNLSKLCELVGDVLLCGFFMHVGHQHNPSFYG